MNSDDIKVGDILRCVADDHSFVSKNDLVEVERIDCAPYRSQPSVKFVGHHKMSYISNVTSRFEKTV